MAKLSAMAAKKRAKELAARQAASTGPDKEERGAAQRAPPATGAGPGTSPPKKLRPSLQKLRITGFSKKRPTPTASDDSDVGQRAAKRPKGAQAGAENACRKGPGKRDAPRGQRDRKGTKGKRSPRPVVNDERAREGNNEIAQFGNRKMLREAQECFETAIRKNLANSHTYTIMINAHVRCGDADGAAKVLKRMCKASLQPCVVAYTTLINGKCRAGDLQGGFEVLRAMLERRPPVLPNVRTVNTLLRGCLLVGGVSEARSLLERMHREWAAEPDASTYEYVISLLAQDLRLEEATNIVDELRRAASSIKKAHDSGTLEAGADAARHEGHALASAASPALYVSIARGAVLLADWAAFAKAHKRAVKALKESAEAGVEMSEPAGETGRRGAVAGGKQGWRVRDDSRQSSAHVFDTHRRDELQVCSASSLRPSRELTTPRVVCPDSMKGT
jgi:pentatricopeptide repeat protein